VSQLTPAWTELRPHSVQSRLWRCPTRFAAVVAGRGSGKTELARRKIVYSLAIKKPWVDPIYVFALPTYNQAEKIAWVKIMQLVPEEWIAAGTSNAKLTLKTVFGSTLYVVGMDKPHRIEGMQIDGIVLDESSDQKPGIFNLTIRPMLTERDAWAWRIGVPKRSGVGRVEFQTFFKLGNQYTVDSPELKEGGEISSFWWESADILTKEEMESVKEMTDEQGFKEQYKAHFLDMGGSVYHAYSNDNLSEAAQYDPSRRILVGMDFNVDPMSWLLCHMIDGKLVVFEEVFLRNTNTEKALKYVQQKYSMHDQGFTFVGDASSRARKTSASRSDYLIIKNYEGFGDKKVVFARKNPPILDRFATVNAGFCNAKGERRIFINPNCKHLINDLNVMSFKEGTTEVENYDGTDIGHISDGLGYLAMKALPMRLDRKVAPTIITSEAAA
jgi:hypothetical protein